MDIKLVLIVVLLLVFLQGTGMIENFCKHDKHTKCPSYPDCPNECASADETLKGTPKGTWETYRYPHYYGTGTWGYHYGEPYYKRFVRFPYPGAEACSTCN